MSVDLRNRGASGGPAPREGQRTEPATGGGWGWVLQVVTGGALLVLVVVHLVAQHFVVDAPGGLRDYASVLDYLGNPVIVVIESLFMLAVTWHAMLGVRSILLDLGLSPIARGRVTVGVTALGVLTLGYGFWMITVLATG
jgi:succinate dehydrogenase / fumarate reductase cytochrome b subunit